MPYRLAYIAIFCLTTCHLNTTRADHDWRLFNSALLHNCDTAMDCDGGSCDTGCDSLYCSRSKSCYLSVFGGLSILNDYNGETEVPTPPPVITPTQTRGSFSDGIGFGVAIGREFHDCLRAELEYSFRSNAGDDWWVNGSGTYWSGNLNTSPFMSNVYYDFKNCNFHNLVPYVGTGIGVVFTDSDFNTPAVNVSINDEAFAYQFIAGASKPMSNSIDLFAEYRFLGTNDLLVQRTSPLPAQKIGDFKMESNNVFFGFRWSH